MDSGMAHRKLSRPASPRRHHQCSPRTGRPIALGNPGARLLARERVPKSGPQLKPIRRPFEPARRYSIQAVAGGWDLWVAVPHTQLASAHATDNWYDWEGDGKEGYLRLADRIKTAGAYVSNPLDWLASLEGHLVEDELAQCRAKPDSRVWIKKGEEGHYHFVDLGDSDGPPAKCRARRPLRRAVLSATPE